MWPFVAMVVACLGLAWLFSVTDDPDPPDADGEPDAPDDAEPDGDVDPPEEALDGPTWAAREAVSRETWDDGSLGGGDE